MYIFENLLLVNHWFVFTTWNFPECLCTQINMWAIFVGYMVTLRTIETLAENTVHKDHGREFWKAQLNYVHFMVMQQNLFYLLRWPVLGPNPRSACAFAPVVGQSSVHHFVLCGVELCQHRQSLRPKLLKWNLRGSILLVTNWMRWYCCSGRYLTMSREQFLNKLVTVFHHIHTSEWHGLAHWENATF